MQNKKSSKPTIFVALLVSMTVLTGFLAFADMDPTIDSTLCRVNQAAISCTNRHYLEEAVIKLMEEGKLSKEKVEKILEYKKKRMSQLKAQVREPQKDVKNQHQKGSLLRDLIKDQIITEDEAQIIKQKLREMKESRLGGGIQGLVDSGVLSGKDIDNIRVYMLKARDERNKQIEKLNAMTPAERNEYFERSKKERKDILDRMVEDKVITKEQAEAIKKAIPEFSKEMRRKSN